MAYEIVKVCGHIIFKCILFSTDQREHVRGRYSWSFFPCIRTAFWSSAVLMWDHVLLVSGLWGLAHSRLWGAAVMLTPETLVQVQETLNPEKERLSWGQIKILQCFVPLFEVFDVLCFLKGTWRSIFQMWRNLDYDFPFRGKIRTWLWEQQWATKTLMSHYLHLKGTVQQKTIIVLSLWIHAGLLL